MYCTPKAVQEQILKRKLLTASGCAVTLNKDRPDAATRRPAFPDVPDDLLLLLLGYCGASSLLALETASRALLDLLRSPARHKQQESLWCGCLRARFPREGPALCSLGDHERRLGLRPRAPARQIYRAFCTKKDAEEDIENVVAPGEGALEELAFIAVVGGFAGVASWDEETDPMGLKREFLRWQPPSSAVRLGQFENLEAYEQGQATVAELMGDRLDRVRQELHVIDLRSFLCVTLVSTVPRAVGTVDVDWAHVPPYLQNGDAVFFSKSSGNFMTGFGDYGACCLLTPTLALRPTPDDSRLLFVDFFPEAKTPPGWEHLLWTVKEMRYPHFFHKSEELCEFVAEVIRQTHSLRR
jgi:hypothetical protein